MFIEARTANGDIVESFEVSYSEYYTESMPVVDEDAYRKNKSIRSLEGKIYDSDGNLEQHFCNEYNEAGEYAGGRAVFSDGTVQED